MTPAEAHPLDLAEPDGSVWRAPSRAALDVERVRRYGLSEFARLAWPHIPQAKPMRWEWHLDEVCRHVEAVYSGEDGCSELVINIPPGHTKSTIVSVAAPAWIWTDNPRYQFMSASFDFSNARRHSEYTLALMKSRWYVERWGHVLGKSDNVTEYTTRAGGSRFTTSCPAGKGLGRHCDMFSIDDPIKASEATGASASKLGKMIEKVNQWFGSTVVGRRTGRDQRIVLTMQRLHENDLSAFMLKTMGATHLMLPIKFERDRRCVTPFGGDRRTLQGDALTQRLGLAEKFVAANGGWDALMVQAQLQQNPTPKGGTMFKRDAFKRFDRPLDPREFRKRITCLSVDPTFKDGEESDFVSLQVWSFEPGEGFRLWHRHSERMGFVATVQAIGDILRAWPCVHVLIEDKANGSATIDTLRRKFPVVPVMPMGGKEARARAASFHVSAGRVLIANEAWGEEVIEQCTSFPRATHDDDVDTLSQAVLWLASEYGYSESWADAMTAWEGERESLIVDPRAAYRALFR